MATLIRKVRNLHRLHCSVRIENLKLGKFRPSHRSFSSQPMPQAKDVSLCSKRGLDEVFQVLKSIPTAWSHPGPAEFDFRSKFLADELISTKANAVNRRCGYDPDPFNAPGNNRDDLAR